MRTIYETSVIELLPENLRNDPDMIAASKAVDLGFLVLVDEAKNITMLPNVRKVSEDVLDHIAYFLKVDFYDRALPLEVKQNLVEDSLYSHQIKGTPKAVELLIETVFDEGDVQEWFEYGGDPYTFRVTTANQSATQERAEEFIRAINTVKNVRSRLESVILLQREQMDLYWGGFLHTGSKEVYRMEGS
jgi:phage tail P2-like protein